MTDSWTIGSNPECDVVVTAPTVSGHHCRLSRHADGYLLEDLQSTNGTFVNDMRLTEPLIVTPSSHITLGQTIPMPWPAEVTGQRIVAHATSTSTSAVSAPSFSASSFSASTALPAVSLSKGKKSGKGWQLVLGGVVMLGLIGGLNWVIQSATPVHKQADREVGCFEGHRQPVRCLAVSLDGKQAISGGDDKLARVWDVAKRKEEGTLKGHESRINGVAFSTSGKRAATAGDDSTARVWNLTTFQEVTRCQKNSGPVTCVAFYPSGQYVASGSTDHSLTMWDAADGEPFRSFPGHLDAVTCVAFSPNGKILASGSADHSVRLWDVRTGEKRFVCQGHLNTVSQLSFSPTSDKPLSASLDGTLRMWDVETGNCVQEWKSKHSKSPLKTVCFSTGGTRAMCGGEDQEVRLWHAEDGTEMDHFPGHQGAVTCCWLLPSGRVGLSGAMDGTVRLWELPAPLPEELHKTKQSLDTMRATGDKLQQYADWMQQAKQAVDDEKPAEALTAFEKAETFTEADTLERDQVQEASAKVRAAKVKGDQYAAHLKAGKAAMEKHDFALAKQEFAAAEKIYPDRKEGKEGFDKADEAMKKTTTARHVEGALTGAKFTPELGWDFVEGNEPLLDRGTDFAFLILSRTEDPAVGLAASKLEWTFRVETPNAFPEDADVKFRVEVYQDKPREQLVQRDHPFVANTKQQLFRGSCPPPAGGWKAGEYEIRTLLITPKGEEQREPPRKISLGLMHWKVKKLSVTAAAVQESNFAVSAGVRPQAGDALKLRATGTVTPAPLAFYRDLVDDKALVKPMPADPLGLAWSKENRNLAKYMIVDGRFPYAALLYRMGTKPWMPYQHDTKFVLAPETEPIFFTINSVSQARNSLTEPMRAILPTDTRYWQPDSGSFEVTLWHGVFDFTERLSEEMKYSLLKRFEN